MVFLLAYMKNKDICTVDRRTPMMLGNCKIIQGEDGYSKLGVREGMGTVSWE